MKTKMRKIMSLLLALTIITGLMSPMTVMSEARSIIIKDNFEPEPLNTDIYAFPVTDYDEETREITLQTFICGVKGRSKIDFHFAITELTFLDWSAPQDGYNHNVIVDGSSYELTVDGYFDDDVVLAATIRYKAPQEEYFDWEIMTLEDSYADGSVLIKTEYEGEYYTAGDVDGDGKVTAEDAQLMLEAYIGECFLSLPALSAAMIDGKDADISISEIRSVLRYASKLDATLGESLTDVPSGYDSNNMPACRIESEYDEEKGFLDITVSAINMKNHHSAKIALEIPDSLRWGYYEKVNTDCTNSVGISLIDGNFTMAAVSAEAFGDDTVPIASFEFIVDKDTYSSSDEIKATLVYDDSGSEVIQTFTNPASSSENRIMGDMNSDGKVTPEDAKIMMSFALELEIPTMIQLKKGDIDSDGEISLAEARSVLRYSAELEDTVKVSDDAVPGAQPPSVNMGSSYDSEKSILTLKVYAENMEGHTTAQVVFKGVPGLEFVSASPCKGSYSCIAGSRAGDFSFAAGVISMEAFGEYSVELATFEFKVNEDELTSSCINFNIELTYDNKNVINSISRDIDVGPVCNLPSDGNAGNLYNPDDESEELGSNFLYPWFYYDEDDECALFGVQLCNFNNVSAFPNGKITLNYPADSFKYTGFETGETEGVSAAVSETSPGVLVIDYTAGKDVPATDNMLVDLMFDVIAPSGFVYAEIKSVSPTYMTDRDGNKIDFSISQAKAICAHKNTYSVDGKDPSCTSAGSRGGEKCAMCGEIFNSVYIAPLGHKYDDSNKCTVCGEYRGSYTNTIDFNGGYIKDSGVVDIDISFPNDEMYWKYELAIEYPASSLIYMDSNYYINGVKSPYPGNYEISDYVYETGGKSCIIIKVNTNDYSVISDDISFNFKFYAPSKTAETFTFKLGTSADYKAQTRAYLGLDMVDGIPGAKFTVTANLDYVPSEPAVLSVYNSMYTVIDEENQTVLVTPISPDGVSSLDFKNNFKNTIEHYWGDDEIINTGDLFSFAGISYVVAVRGDLNQDGKITAADARTILRIAAKLETPDELAKSAADINSDGKITTSEARDVLRFSAKLSPIIFNYVPGK